MSKSIRLNFRDEPTAWQRLSLFLGHYDCRIYISDRSYVDLGAGSFDCFGQLTLLYDGGGLTGCLGSVGRWCEFSPSCEVMGRGEHDHSKPVNVMFGRLRQFVHATSDVGMKPAEPISIGNGVVISAGAKVLTGVKVGDGAVIGAGAIVTKDVHPFEIVAGAPAKPINRRSKSVPWWDFSVAYIIENMDQIQDVAARLAGHVWQKQRPRFALRRDGAEYKIIGCVDRDTHIAVSELPHSVRDYLAGIVGHGPYTWVSDCWPD